MGAGGGEGPPPWGCCGDDGGDNGGDTLPLSDGGGEGGIDTGSTIPDTEGDSSRRVNPIMRRSAWHSELSELIGDVGKLPSESVALPSRTTFETCRRYSIGLHVCVDPWATLF
jgi:hypothetical protein